MEKTIMVLGGAIGTVIMGAILYQLFVGDILAALMPTICAFVERLNSILTLSMTEANPINLPGCT